jgi:N-acetylglucosaminyldiphosphoundecaprenol N-acetyl-beta-D-mannosaminyltransferase
MHQSRQQLWLAEMRPHLLRMLQSAHLNTHFMCTTSVEDALYRTAKAEQREFAQHVSEQDSGRVPPNTVQVRLELLEDICQKITVNPAMSPTEYDTSPASGRRYSFRTTMG